MIHDDDDENDGYDENNFKKNDKLFKRITERIQIIICSWPWTMGCLAQSGSGLFNIDVYTWPKSIYSVSGPHNLFISFLTD